MKSFQFIVLFKAPVLQDVICLCGGDKVLGFRSPRTGGPRTPHISRSQLGVPASLLTDTGGKRDESHKSHSHLFKVLPRHQAWFRLHLIALQAAESMHDITSATARGAMPFRVCFGEEGGARTHQHSCPSKTLPSENTPTAVKQTLWEKQIGLKQQAVLLAGTSSSSPSAAQARVRCQ